MNFPCVSRDLFRAPLLVFTIAIGWSAAVEAQSLYTVVSVEPSNPVLHGLEAQTSIDTNRRWVNMRGPQYYSSPAQADDTPDYLNWYEIRKPEVKAVKTIELTDEFSGEQSFSVSLSQPAYYLIPAQTVKDGPPKSIPADLNLFIAFRIADVESVALPEPTPGRPAFVCLPAEQWHHAEHLAIKSNSRLLMVYEVEEAESGAKVTTIDQFGLNAMAVGKQRYVYVHAKRAN